VLAYGDKKRVELARAIVGKPKLLLLDEPVAGLNAKRPQPWAISSRNLRRAGHTILLVEHDMDLVMNIADLVVVLDSGRCIATGTADEVRRNPLVLEAYLGRMEATA
jgi:branched-chain amino acid transport system ATP-binding protein